MFIYGEKLNGILLGDKIRFITTGDPSSMKLSPRGAPEECHPNVNGCYRGQDFKQYLFFTFSWVIFILYNEFVSFELKRKKNYTAVKINELDRHIRKANLAMINTWRKKRKVADKIWYRKHLYECKTCKVNTALYCFWIHTRKVSGNMRSDPHLIQDSGCLWRKGVSSLPHCNQWAIGH